MFSALKRRLFYHWGGEGTPQWWGRLQFQSLFPWFKAKSQHEFTNSHLLPQKDFISRISYCSPAPSPKKRQRKQNTLLSCIPDNVSLSLVATFNPSEKKKKKGDVKATFAIVTIKFHGQKWLNQCSQATRWRECLLLSNEGKSLLVQMCCIREGRSGLLCSGQGGCGHTGMLGCGEEGMQGCGDARMWGSMDVETQEWGDAEMWGGESLLPDMENPHSPTDISALCAWEWVQFPLQRQSLQEPSNQIFLRTN